MQQSDFITYLDHRGVLRDGQAINGGLRAHRGAAFNDTDWIGLTKLTASAFADELPRSTAAIACSEAILWGIGSPGRICRRSSSERSGSSPMNIHPEV